MFQLALRFRGIEVEQDADAARQSVDHGDFRSAEQRHVAPPEEPRRACRVLGREVGRRRENGALHVFGLKAVRLQQRAQQLRRRLENRLARVGARRGGAAQRSEEHTSELQSQSNLVCRLLLEKKKKKSAKRQVTLSRSNVLTLLKR